MGISQSKNNSDTINWNNIHTDDMNSSIPGMNGGLSNDAKLLLAKITLPEISETNSINEFDLNNILDDKNTNTKNYTNLKNNEDLTASPFISSEMYNYLLNKNKNNNILKGGANDENFNEEIDTSSTSSTSSDSENISEHTEFNESESIKKKPKKDKKDKKNKKDKKDKDKNIEKIVQDIDDKEYDIDENVEIYKGKRSTKNSYKNKIKESENYLSYVSSSAHTGKSVSESILNENNYTISSINTSDINMISE
jgi:hypothetical protein